MKPSDDGAGWRVQQMLSHAGLGAEPIRKLGGVVLDVADVYELVCRHAPDSPL